MTLKTENPGALAGATGVGMDLQASAAIHVQDYPNHRDLQVRRLVRALGIPRHRAEVMVPLIFGEGLR